MVYLAAFVVGGIAVLAALVLTDVDLGHGGGHGTAEGGLPFLSLTSLSAGLLGAGTGGLDRHLGRPASARSAAVAVTSGLLLIGGLQGVLLPYLRRQQANSHRGRSSYIGLLGTVTLDVPAAGWGEVAFIDADGNRVRARAVTAEPNTLTKSTPVYIADVDADYLHVVTIPDLPAPERN